MELCLFFNENKNSTFFLIQISEKIANSMILFQSWRFCNFEIKIVIMQNFKQLKEKKMWNFFSGTLKLKIPHKFFSRLH